jgi:gamma-D-glutamyl-L-lysine dipeptidyl-peptidase
LPPPPSERASCSAEIPAVRVEPREDAEQVTQALRCEPLSVYERRGDWARIETAYAYPGWIRDEAVGPPLPGRWLERRAQDVLAAARSYLGTPYERGGMSERGIDCSGLVHMAFRRIGIVVPRDSWQQEAAGEPVPPGELEPGDVLCYPGHVAFWAGEGRVLHASSREGLEEVVEEPEPPELAAERRSARRFRRK